MKLDERCYDCLLSRVVLECGLCNASPGLTSEIRAECARLLEDLRITPLSHPEIASAIHRRAYSMLGNDDPFRELKSESTRQAMEVCRSVRPRLHSFRDFVLASIIGNTFDYGVRDHAVHPDFHRYFEYEFVSGLYVDDCDRILPLASRLVYFTDNCGEIVFDRLLLQYLQGTGSHITLALRDAPVLNDATLAEARELHLDRYVDTMTTTGCGCEIGVRLDCMPADLEAAMEECTLVLSKGMANYESLSTYKDLPPVAYLMAVKCDPVAEDVGVPRGVKIAMLRE
ncbi:MAG: ARMT1-like domain-containing protein [Methanolinea sp.]|nr:ARMT1-like domain-containing protein [Methanolinea sp.]